MNLSIETIGTAQESIEYSIHKISNFDYSYGRYDPDKHDFYRQCRQQSLEPLLKAQNELREYVKYLKELKNE